MCKYAQSALYEALTFSVPSSSNVTLLFYHHFGLSFLAVVAMDYATPMNAHWMYIFLAPGSILGMLHILEIRQS